ncbi:peptidoglycan-associated lipoprotein Pal [Entomobacter blattae]|uniref:Peptidoglycan-associated lipoprotein n=1 Tax=Entomobacter blattae TaxID=2762277 RepID=A0A7H1NTD6_9PROT|nr:peptidoglycan-associated lipoprotein Pal [Entomobacter blattae]QNT79046.1 OmpA family protein [Entomobacter blattae]
MNLKLVAALGLSVFLVACSDDDADQGAATGMGTTSGQNAGSITPGTQADLVANVGDRIFFAFDSNNLSSEARATLDRQSAWLQKYSDVNVMIAGNCDDRGTEEYNIALGSRRANAARDYIVARGISPARISTISYGKDRPTATGSGEEVWAQNRNAITSVK